MKWNSDKILVYVLAMAFSFHKAIVRDYIENKEFLEINVVGFGALVICLFVLFCFYFNFLFFCFICLLAAS